jgi:hypothetical protein
MLDLLRDPLWQFVGVVLGIGASVAIYRLQKLNKRLAYEIISRTTLLTVREELENKVQVLYDGSPVQSLTVFLVRVWNAGSEPIRSSDFERPLSFSAAAPAQILTVDTAAVLPGSLTPELVFEAHSLTVAPMLLNPGDSLTLKVLVKDASASLEPDARIVGVTRIQEGDGASRRLAVVTGVGMLMFLAGAAVAAFDLGRAAATFYELKPGETPQLLAPPTVLVVAIIGYLFTGYVALRSGAFRHLRILVRRARVRWRSDA